MAVSIISQPTTPNVTGTKLVYTVSGSDITHPQYNYVLDIYLSGSTERLDRQFQVPNANGVAEFQPSGIFNSYLSYDNFWKINQEDGSTPYTGSIGNPINAVKTFNVKAGEAYGTSISSSLTIYTGSSDNYIQLFPGTLDPKGTDTVLNAGYNFNSASFGDIPFASSSRSNLLTNYPTQQYAGGWIEDTQFFTKADYGTVTQYNNANTSPTTAAIVVQGFLNTGDSRTAVKADTLIPGAFNSEFFNQAFFTWGIGPKNLSNVLDPDTSTYEWRAYIDNGTINEIDINAPGRDDTRYFIRDNVFNNRVYQQNLVGSENEDSLTVPLNTEYVQFAFINQFGFYDYYDCFQPLRRTSNAQKKIVSLPKVDYSGQVSTYDIETGGGKVFYEESFDTYTITTDWLGESISNWLKELLDSPEVYIRQQDNYVPIVITNTKYEHNNSEARNKLFQYTIEFKPSNGRDLYSEEYECKNVTFQTFKHHFEVNSLPSSTATAITEDLGVNRLNLPLYSKDWRLGNDVLDVTLSPTGSIDVQQSFFYTSSDIGFEPEYRVNIGSTFDLPSKLDIEVYGDSDLIFSTSSFIPASNNRRLNPVSPYKVSPFTGSFTGNYDTIIYSSSLNYYSTQPILGPDWYYNSQQILALSAWDDTLGVGRNFPGNNTPETGYTRINYFTSESRGPYTGNWWNVDPNENTLNGLQPNDPWINGNNGSAAGLTGSNYTLQSWVYINEFSEIDSSTPRSVFFTLTGDSEIGGGKIRRVSVGSRQSGSVNVLSISGQYDPGGGLNITQLFPNKVIDTGSWYQISLVQDGTNFNDLKVYVDNETASYSPTASADMRISGSYTYAAGTFTDSSALSGSIANVICYSTSSLTQAQVATNYTNINNYLSTL